MSTAPPELPSPSPSAAPRAVLRVHPEDNLIVALADLEAGREVALDGHHWRLAGNVPAKHKFAAVDLPEGAVVTMYGLTVGRATRPVPAGARITVENVRHATQPAAVGADGRGSRWSPPDVSRWRDASFFGYRRPNGAVGTANTWIVVPLVFCENRNLQAMKDALLGPLGYGRHSGHEDFVRRLVEAHRRGAALGDVGPIAGEGAAPPTAQRVFPNVDGIKFLSHTLGCGGTNADSAALCGLLAGYATHPNVAGVTVLSLGCQKAQFETLREEIHRRDPGFAKPLHFFEQQKSRSERQMLSDALRATFEGLRGANECRREPAPLHKLVVGMECGGSDGFSGISANPVIGAVADRLAALRAGVILSEFPELCGVEQHLVDRCATAELARRFLDLMDAYQRAAGRVGSGFDQNPSHGNIADGLITDAMKSAGAALKGGTSPVEDVIDYPGMVTKPGLSLLCTPGNDVESTTAMAGAHASLMLFSTGLGTPTGNPVCPVLKISSNSAVARSLPDVIDFDTGGVIRGESTIDGLADALLDLAIETASGRNVTCAQRLGQDDFIPWKRGVSL